MGTYPVNSEIMLSYFFHCKIFNRYNTWKYPHLIWIIFKYFFLYFFSLSLPPKTKHTKKFTRLCKQHVNPEELDCRVPLTKVFVVDEGQRLLGGGGHGRLAGFAHAKHVLSHDAELVLGVLIQARHGAGGAVNWLSIPPDACRWVQSLDHVAGDRWAAIVLRRFPSEGDGMLVDVGDDDVGWWIRGFCNQRRPGWVTKTSKLYAITNEKSTEENFLNVLTQVCWNKSDLFFLFYLVFSHKW